MANTTVNFHALITGLSGVTVDLYPRGNDTAAASAVAASAHGAWYQIVVTGALAGLHTGVVKLDGNDTGARFMVDLVDEVTTLYPVGAQDTIDELEKVPRKGETFRHRQVASDGANESADVIIEDAS